MSEHARSIVDWVIKAAAALIPVFLATLVTIAWSNSHSLAVLRIEQERTEQEVVHLRELLEKQLMAPGRDSP